MEFLTDRQRVSLERAGWQFVRLANDRCEWVKFNARGHQTKDLRGAFAWHRDKALVA